MERHETLTIMAGFLATALTILKMALNQQRTFLERCTSFFDDTLKRQTQSVDTLGKAVATLSEGVRENSQLLLHLTEWLQVSTPVGRS